ncbi:MAG: hypothetical protein JJ896_13760 [Rhodothermales bacterium]|nr:hypothetical protein [Rhodothermales bacterium]MBO6780715.1 hypothetical protein [Rhodothermales bacterium]
MDYGTLDGGLVRMMNRFWAEGTLTGEPEEDLYLRSNANAVLFGMLYDQRMLAEQAFMGARRLHERLGHLDPGKIAQHDPDEFRTLFAQTPAVHRFTNKMAAYTQQVAQVLVDQYDGDAGNIWAEDRSADEVAKLLEKLPGFGKMKAYKMRFALHYFGWRDFSDVPAKV